MKPVASFAPTTVYEKRVKLPSRPRGLYPDSSFLTDDHLACDLGVILLDLWPQLGTWTRQRTRAWKIRKNIKGLREKESKA